MCNLELEGIGKRYIFTTYFNTRMGGSNTVISQSPHEALVKLCLAPRKDSREYSENPE
jgi:hypothetical protein